MDGCQGWEGNAKCGRRGSRKEKWGLMTPRSVVLLSFKVEAPPQILPSETCIFHLLPTLVLLTSTLQFDQHLVLEDRLSCLGPEDRIPG